MEVVCDGCKTRLSIPEEKIPPGQRVSIRCPKCGKRLLLDTPGTGAGTGKAPGPESGGPRASRGDGAVDRPGPSSPNDLPHPPMDEYAILDSYEEGVKLALVMESDEARAERVREALEGLGYRYVPAETVEDALTKLRFFNFELVIVSDGFEGLALEKNPVLSHLNGLSMSIRRTIFVTLLGDRFRSMDKMAAFALSANLVVSLKDLDRLLIILRRALTDNEKFYKVFFDTLKEVGKG